VLYEENDKVESIYFIKEGEVEISKLSKVELFSKPLNFNNKTNRFESEAANSPNISASIDSSLLSSDQLQKMSLAP